MKRGIISFCLLVALLFGASIGVAADTEYYIEEGGFTVTVPDGYHVLHRDIAEDDPVLDVLGMTASDLVADMEEGQLYLDMFDEEVHYEITITVFSDEDSEATYNLRDFSNEEILSSIKDHSYSDIEGVTVDVDSISVTGFDQYKFVQLPYTYTDGETEESALRNYTIVNGQYIIMDVAVYDPAFYNEATGLLSSLTNSLRFDEIKDSPLLEDSERTEENASDSNTSEGQFGISPEAQWYLVLTLLIFNFAMWIVGIVYAILCIKGKVVVGKNFTCSTNDYLYHSKLSCGWLSFYRQVLLIIWVFFGAIRIVYYFMIGDYDFIQPLVVLDVLPIVFTFLVFLEINKFTPAGYRLNIMLLWFLMIGNICASFFSVLNGEGLTDLIGWVIFESIFLPLNLIYFRKRKVLFYKKAFGDSFTDEKSAVSFATLMQLKHDVDNDLITKVEYTTKKGMYMKEIESGKIKLNMFQLTQLLSEGIITQEEYESKKKDLLEG